MEASTEHYRHICPPTNHLMCQRDDITKYDLEKRCNAYILDITVILSTVREIFDKTRKR